ncbi:hypothetical protein F5Y14DRAFT_460607 [Nemania sp. NC0429]|nr:hypothetical protein F5Y14DRAFT_460607 [Nemania sp. NC0429]
MKPLYTREILNHAEAALARDEEYIEVMNAEGRTQCVKNSERGSSRDVPPGERGWRNIIAFRDERNLARLEAAGRAEDFFPLYPFNTMFHGPDRTEAETRATLRSVIEAFEASDEAAAITRLVTTNLRGCAVNKVIAFGLGRIGVERRGPPTQSFYEHAAARVLARAVEAVSSEPGVLLVQDPLYTDVCCKVLEEFGFGVVQGFGAKGFALLDRKSVVLAHHPSFPFREIIADLARPALICMKPEEEVEAGTGKPSSRRFQDMRAEVDSERSRKMLEEYRGVRLPCATQRAFYGNIWYVRKAR